MAILFKSANKTLIIHHLKIISRISIQHSRSILFTFVSNNDRIALIQKRFLLNSAVEFPEKSSSKFVMWLLHYLFIFIPLINLRYSLIISFSLIKLYKKWIDEIGQPYKKLTERRKKKILFLRYYVKKKLLLKSTPFRIQGLCTSIRRFASYYRQKEDSQSNSS